MNVIGICEICNKEVDESNITYMEEGIAHEKCLQIFVKHVENTVGKPPSELETLSSDFSELEKLDGEYFDNFANNFKTILKKTKEELEN